MKLHKYLVNVFLLSMAQNMYSMDWMLDTVANGIVYCVTRTSMPCHVKMQEYELDQSEMKCPQNSPMLKKGIEGREYQEEQYPSLEEVAHYFNGGKDGAFQGVPRNPLKVDTHATSVFEEKLDSPGSIACNFSPQGTEKKRVVIFGGEVLQPEKLDRSCCQTKIPFSIQKKGILKNN